MEKLIIEFHEKIKKQIIDIKQLSSEDKYFRLDDYVKSILNLISELSNLLNDENDKRKYDKIWTNLDYTLDRKVKYAKSAYNKARKKNAPFIRESEYRTMLHDAIKQVELELADFRY
jgi:flagellin-specific chaperone FliS